MTNYNDHYDAIYDEIQSQLSTMNDTDLISIWNTFAYDEGYYNSVVFDNNEESLEELCDDVRDAIFKVCYGDYRYRDNYVSLDGNENLVSFDRLNDKNSPIDLNDLSDWLALNERFEDFDELDLSDLLDELEEDDEDI
ncbi:hypothetical protein [Megasphaera massiliensis]|jgi:hypothetical protein|uniref:hypothetical protein n=1 Tax=Megasphaera massiliensis TaxID=1232428 RepID=UPI002062C192|nr:hypothetical protein [uncultured Megasphaera sp.]DAH87849.1 MAG TPA: hypothetical protein [Bacteriophage sp.]